MVVPGRHRPDKTLRIASGRKCAAKTKRLETRILVRDDLGGVYGGSYKWRDDGTDADLVFQAKSEDVQIKETGGGFRTQSWFYPERRFVKLSL